MKDLIIDEFYDILSEVYKGYKPDLTNIRKKLNFVLYGKSLDNRKSISEKLL